MVLIKTMISARQGARAKGIGVDSMTALAKKMADPQRLWELLALGAPVSATLSRDRETVSLASFAPPNASAWLRFASESEAGDPRDEARPLAKEAMKARFWEMPGVLEALASKLGAPFLAHIGSQWAKEWMEGPQERLAERFNALTNFERKALSAGVSNELVSTASLLLSGVGRPERLAMEWLSVSSEIGERLILKYPSDGIYRSWGMLVAAAVEAHIDYGKTPHWIADGICSCLAGPGFGDDQRAREQAVIGFDKAMESCRFKAGVAKALESRHHKLEPLRLSAALTRREGLKPSRKALKA